MAFQGLAKLALLHKSGAGLLQRLAPVACSSTNSFATAAEGLSRKDVVALLDARDDPEVDAAIRAYQAAALKSGAKAPPPVPVELELTASLEKKYTAAQVVETGLQSISVPLAYAKDGGEVALRRYVAQLNGLAAAAGFESPLAEVSKRLDDAVAVSDSVKELLGRARPLMSADFHAGLLEAVQAVENETGATVTLDGASAGYKKFAAKVAALCAQHKLPAQLLVAATSGAPPADEEAADAQRAQLAAWLGSAQVSDAKAEIEELKGQATALLDNQLTKTAAQVKVEGEAQMAALLRKLESAKGAAWAKKFQEDLQYVQWFDAAVAKDPAAGPRVSA